MTLMIPTSDGPGSAAMGITCETIDRLLGGRPKIEWGDTEYVLKATGREALAISEVGLLGDVADMRPVLR